MPRTDLNDSFLRFRTALSSISYIHLNNLKKVYVNITTMEQFSASKPLFIGHAPHFSVKLNETKRNITLKLKSVSGRNPNEEYILADLHIHLGKEKDVGSEHSIDGTFYPMEVNIYMFIQIFEYMH